ncbi:MAG TPA: glycosyltransferase family 2 protein [Candidatus Binatia bacterium]|nr:glycosyltransferase family 2 protein [Candidatus Binatia bacterium]
MTRTLRRRLSTVGPVARTRLRLWLDRQSQHHDELARQGLRTFLDDPAARLTFEPVSQPEVSVIVVTFGRAELTLECLHALRAQKGASFELIVVDNASSDRTGELLDRIDGARIVRNPANRYFAPAVNQAAAVAEGRHLLLLNNDAVLWPGSLAAMLAAMEESDRVGAVGARIVARSGRLQEAGSIVFCDGSAMGYGRGDDPEGGDYAFRRHVDYCSAACLLVRRSLFADIGGFDLRYLPAYYEDVDLCFAIAERGFVVLYEPAAAVTHAEFASSSAETAAALCKVNQPTFAARWIERLKDAPKPAANSASIRAREQARRFPTRGRS